MAIRKRISSYWITNATDLISSNTIRIPRFDVERAARDEVMVDAEIRLQQHADTETSLQLKGSFHVRIAKLALGVVVAIASAVPLSGQQPRGARNGTTAATTTWQPSRLPDGQPDMQGFWRPAIGGTFSLTSPM